MTPEYISREEYRDGISRIEDVVREGFAQVTMRLDGIGNRVQDSELKVAVLNDRSNRAEQTAKDAATEVASNTRWAKYISPAIAALSGLLSGQIRP